MTKLNPDANEGDDEIKPDANEDDKIKFEPEATDIYRC